MKKEKATSRLKVFPSTHKKLKIAAARKEMTMAVYVEYLYEGK